MKTTSRGSYLDQPAVYEIHVQGRLREAWSQWFGGMRVTIAGDPGAPPVTVLRGEVDDQAALHGLLARIRDLGLPLLLVQLVPPRQQASATAGSMEDEHGND